MVNIQKAAIIGCGFVGASSAFSLLQKGIFSELVLIDANKEKAEGEAMDISHGRPYAHPMKIYAGSYDDISDCFSFIQWNESLFLYLGKVHCLDRLKEKVSAAVKDLFVII